MYGNDLRTEFLDGGLAFGERLLVLDVDESDAASTVFGERACDGIAKTAGAACAGEVLVRCE